MSRNIGFEKLVEQANTGKQQSFARIPGDDDDDIWFSSGIYNYLRPVGGKSRNCTDASGVFGESLSSLFGCAFFPNITRDFRDFGRAIEFPPALKPLHIQVDTSIATSTSVTSFISTCAASWCKNLEGCSSSACSPEQLTINNGTLISAGNLFACSFAICDADPQSTNNPDIAGIGVLCSIIIQVAICYVGIVFLGILYIAESVTEFYGKEKHQLRIRHFLNVLEISLDDFQRAQCCFAVAINVASIVLLASRKQSTTSADRTALILASNSGSIPPTALLLMLLGTKGRRSAYTFCLTLITWTAAVIVEYWRQANVSFKMDDLAVQSVQCGGYSPSNVCGRYYSDMVENEIRFPLALTIPFMVLATVIQWREYMLRVLLPLYTRIERTAPVKFLKIQFQTLRLLFRQHNSPLREGGVSSFLITNANAVGLRGCYMFVILVTNCWRLSRQLPTFPGLQIGSGATEWTFGQIVAVSVWMPTLLSFINDLVYNPIRGRTNQLPRSFEVVEKKKTDESLPVHVSTDNDTRGR